MLEGLHFGLIRTCYLIITQRLVSVVLYSYLHAVFLVRCRALKGDLEKVVSLLWDTIYIFTGYVFSWVNVAQSHPCNACINIISILQYIIFGVQ